MSITTLLIDDEAPARLLLRQYLGDFPQVRVVGECADGLTALATIEQLRPDLLFLDVQMPGLNGLEVLAQLAVIPLVIFCTAYDRYALEAFDTGAVDYLLKPYDRRRFGQAVNRVLQHRSGEPAPAWQQVLQRLDSLGQPVAGPAYPVRLFVPQGTRLVAVETAAIQWVEAAGDYTILYTAGGQHFCNLGLSVLQERLDPRRFLRIHRSALVALDAIAALERDGSGGYFATLVNGRGVRVSRTYAEALRPLLG